MRSFVRIGFMLTVAMLGTVGASQAQQELTKQDRQGPVTVAVTLIGSPTSGHPVKAKVVLDTHSASLDEIVFEKTVAIRTSEGTDIAPTAVEQATGSGHHREAVLIFPPVSGPGPVRVVVRNVGGIVERNFSWELPLAR